MGSFRKEDIFWVGIFIETISFPGTEEAGRKNIVSAHEKANCVPESDPSHGIHEVYPDPYCSDKA